MILEQEIIYFDKKYHILNAEQEFIVHPAAFGLLPLTKVSLQSPFTCEFHIEDYRLIMDRLTIVNDTAGNAGMGKMEENDMECEMNDCQIPYTGAILIGSRPVREYYRKDGKLACFSYQNVFELVFEEGILKTTIDQSKAMLRIRKNIELKFRSLNSSRDLRCIKHFMNTSFIGDYKTFILPYNRMKYLKEMKKKYRNTYCINNL